MTTKNKTRNAVIIWLFSEFLFYLLFLHVEELSFCFQFFFNCNLDFFYQWQQIIKRNMVLFTKKSRCGWVMMNEWLIMSGLKIKTLLLLELDDWQHINNAQLEQSKTPIKYLRKPVLHLVSLKQWWWKYIINTKRKFLHNYYFHLSMLHIFEEHFWHKH